MTSPPTDLVPQVVERGDGLAPYRARKPPEVLLVHLCGFAEGLLVVRCHDLDLAVALVLDRLDESGFPILSAALDSLVASSAKIWTRYVPNEYGNPEAGGTYERELRGTPGATPAIIFATPNPATTEGTTP